MCSVSAPPCLMVTMSVMDSIALGFTEIGRVENIRRVAEVAKLFVEAVTVLCRA